MYIYALIILQLISVCITIHGFIKGKNTDIRKIYVQIYVVLGCTKLMNFLLLNLF